MKTVRGLEDLRYDVDYVTTTRVKSTQVTRVVEWLGPVSTTDVLFPSVEEHAWDREVSWLDPIFTNRAGQWYWERQ